MRARRIKIYFYRSQREKTKKSGITYLSKEALTMGLEDLLKGGMGRLVSFYWHGEAKSQSVLLRSVGTVRPRSSYFSDLALFWGVVLFFDDQESDLAHLAR